MTTKLPALTHHDIVRLVEPFARQGRLVDLAASDRAARRISFRRRDLPGEQAGSDAAAAVCTPASPPTCHETLTLECRADDYFVLLRTVTPASGPAACVRATGADPGDLLARVQAVPVQQLFQAGPGWCVTRSYDAELPRGVRAPRVASGSSLPPLVLSRAELQAGGLRLTLVIKLPGLRSVPADLTLTPSLHTSQAPHAGRPDLPEDLLAVQGWDWARLVPDKAGWTSKLRLRGGVLRRSRTAEVALNEAGAHLARVMASTPGRFHDTHWLARWGMVLRRGIPTLTSVLMVGGALLLTRVLDPANTGLWLALHYVPIALLAMAFSLQELPQFELPPLPRRSAAPGWWASAPARA